ncbi:nuclear transport factor 2 family protein [Flavobacterium sp. F372]|uniref:Nuclear transport factor 2 family protein n=1 Tax=Flavobacterium bernardetii TaxID=2813823 RepID=A0ABR7IVJ9_9FLAO|nr:nuclear transport factor 2 family protein [Flavobacterium bernardetii]MBC5833782.1 nuclear transport factor 2 family protein [Flavobacterium bernardetii]NHF69015.1 nuclear transport factor 2 family protein [Flavobacterium bernardetii]
MRHLLILLFFGFSLSISAQEKQIKQSIFVFFEGLQSADTLKIQSVCHKEMKLQSIMEKNSIGNLSFETNEEFYKSIASIPKNLKIEERILDYKIQIDNSMAQVWTPYEFYINDKLSHFGTNSFTLLLENNVWKIVHIIDTRRKK